MMPQSDQKLEERLLLSHVRSWLSVQSTRALMCLEVWDKMGYVENGDIWLATSLPEVRSIESELTYDWDAI